jgi:hypothetical protein
MMICANSLVFTIWTSGYNFSSILIADIVSWYSKNRQLYHLKHLSHNFIDDNYIYWMGILPSSGLLVTKFVVPYWWSSYRNSDFLIPCRQKSIIIAVFVSRYVINTWKKRTQRFHFLCHSKRLSCTTKQLIVQVIDPRMNLQRAFFNSYHFF